MLLRNLIMTSAYVIIVAARSEGLSSETGTSYFVEFPLESVVVDEGGWEPPVFAPFNPSAFQQPPTGERTRLQLSNRRAYPGDMQPDPTNAKPTPPLVDFNPQFGKVRSPALERSFSPLGDIGPPATSNMQPMLELGMQRANSLPDMDLEASKEDKGREALACGVSMDIGMRRTMEDTYIAASHVGDGQLFPDVRALVGVFDGHNGAGVAQFAADKFVSFMEEMEAQSVMDVIQGTFQR